MLPILEIQAKEKPINGVDHFCIAGSISQVSYYAVQKISVVVVLTAVHA